MIQELIQQVKDIEAQGERTLLAAQDEKTRLLKHAEAEAKALRKQKLEQVRAKVQTMLAQAETEVHAEIESLKQQTKEQTQQIRTQAEKNLGRAISLVIKRLTNGNS